MPDSPSPKSHPILEWDPTSPEPESPDPNSPTFARNFKSFVRKILLVTPEFPRFYADVLIDRAPNSNAAKILRNNYSKILEKVNMAIQQQKSSRTCTHIKVTGVRCDSPSLRGERFCYFHQRMVRGVRTPPEARLHPVALIEDEESIQAALMEVINALMRNTIDLKRAGLILRALHIAVKNASRVRFAVHGSQSVQDIPAYPDPADTASGGTDAPGRPGRSGETDAGRAAAVPSAAPAALEDDLTIHESSAAPPTAPPRRRPDPLRSGKTYEQIVAEYFGYPDVESYARAKAAGLIPAHSVAQPKVQVTPTGTAHVAPDASVRPVPPAVDLTKKKPPLNLKSAPPKTPNQSADRIRVRSVNHRT